MENQEEKTTVNVKGVDVAAWNIARKAASMNDESLGTVVSRSLYQMGKTDLLPPGMAGVVGGNPVGNSGSDLAELLRSSAALVEVTGGKLDVVPGLKGLLAERIRMARGLPPTKRQMSGWAGKPAANLLSADGNPGGKPPVFENGFAALANEG